MDLGRYARAEHWVVRRWVSSTDAQVAIHGRAGKVMPWGENWVGSIEFQVVAGGATVYEAVIDGGAQGYSATAAVQAGMPVDFLIGPGTGIGVVEFTGTIQAAGGNALQ
jgi:hypothetical protein